MSDSVLRAATLAVSCLSLVVGVAALLVTLWIKNAILTERDTMKEWVHDRIREAMLARAR